MITTNQMRAARALLSWEQKELAQQSGLSLPTIQRMEKLGLQRSSVENAQKLLDAFDRGGIEFIPENGGGPGVRLKG